jgi:hypothetical protein
LQGLKQKYGIFFFVVLTLWLPGEGGLGNAEFGREVSKARPKNFPLGIELGFSRTICHWGSLLTT